MSLWVERLARHHRRAAFRSGRAEWDEWFHEFAGQRDRRGDSARVWVLCDDEVGRGTQPIGFYSVGTHAVTVAGTSTEPVLGLPKGYPIPAVLLARLAIHEDRQKSGLGTRLLADAVRRVAFTDEHLTVPLLVVDAADDLSAAFYERYGFRRMPSEEDRLAARVADIRRTFA